MLFRVVSYFSLLILKIYYKINLKQWFMLFFLGVVLKNEFGIYYF